jgi:hypothetical protein
MKCFRQDLLGRETELVQAFRETEAGLKQLGEVDAGRLDAPLEPAHRLLQHLENQQPRVNALQSEIGQLQATCTAEESRLLANKSKELDETTTTGAFIDRLLPQVTCFFKFSFQYFF